MFSGEVAMNCKQYRDKIVHLIAAGADLQPSEVSAHLRACFGCREFYETQVSLFRSIDAGMQSLVNQPGPPSLLPGVHARLQDESARHRLLVPACSFSIFAVAAVIAASLSSVRHRPQGFSQSAQWESQASEVRQLASLAPEADPEPPSTHPNLKHSHESAPAPRFRTLEEDQEVIVLPEERGAFAKFVAAIPEEREMAVALVGPTAKAPDFPVEIALLQIERVEVELLEGTPRE
jgi:hypothetical protein